MLKYAKIINEQKQCVIGLGNDENTYKSLGMSEMEVELAYDGYWYVKGYAPTKPIEVMQQEVRQVRNSYLEQYVDPKQLFLVWESLSLEDKQMYINYRNYLLDYTKGEEWYMKNPKNLDEWKSDTINDTDDTINEEENDVD